MTTFGWSYCRLTVISLAGMLAPPGPLSAVGLSETPVTAAAGRYRTCAASYSPRAAYRAIVVAGCAGGVLVENT
ncbi:hypothetical protein [Nonomuraea zeae]|uniref:Secreted protein n=1 Tax=Nonomuraea zeae TaxID=1642303 RepID=A0A5S4GFU7_9ACTN|nr:hypothetical protein [Nonomuraea zeae]TMR31856.1 hypothetical protein ETD85_24485 [Nonomuraea zeae]